MGFRGSISSFCVDVDDIRRRARGRSQRSLNGARKPLMVLRRSLRPLSFNDPTGRTAQTNNPDWRLSRSSS